MNTLLDDDEDVVREHHEVTLSTGTILGIFFGLVLLCGLFFGFGYKMGSHKATVPEQVVAESAPAPSTNFSSFKPAAGSPSNGGGSATANADPASAGEPKLTRAERREAERLKKDEAAAATEPAAAPAGAAPTASGAEPTGDAGTFVVQVAAVSHPEDAQLLVSALRAKGYPVSAHTAPQDKFFHIQVGPYATHKDADAAKQRLLADGYQPIVK